MTRFRASVALAALLVAGTALAACGGSSSASDTTDTTISVKVRAFYEVPDPIPDGAPGTVIRTQSVAVPKGAPAGARGWRVLYLSRTASGAATVTSGLVFAPSGTVPEGGRPVMSWAHETTGIADDCAPSYSGEPTFSTKDLGTWLRTGYVVAATDYEGLGTPGVHPYLVGPSEGHGVLDAARAAKNMTETGAGNRVAVYGYSQGGHAALFAAQEAPSYAPDLTIVGTVATAPPADLSQVATSLATDRQLYGFGVLAAFGLHAGYPDQVSLSQVLAPGIVALADRVQTTCSAFAFFALATQPFDRVFNPAVVADPAVNRLLAVSSAGASAPEGPVLIFSGGKDTLATPAMIDAYLNRVCPQGAQVEVVFEPGLDHGGINKDDFATAFPWINDRFAGKPVTPGCPVRR